MRSKRIQLGIVNIAVFPHVKGRSTYHTLFSELAKMEKFVKVRGDEYAYITSYSSIVEGDAESDLTGEIHKFLEIDKEGWENVRSKKTASADDLKEVVIPPHLKPNSDRFRYFFFTKEHKLVFQMKGDKRSLSHASMKALLDGLIKTPSFVKKFPFVEVTIETEPHALDTIWELKKLQSLYIEVNRPNPDSIDEDAEKWVDHLLGAQGARRQVTELTAAPNDTLKPNEENKKLARAASSNGKVVASGRDERKHAITIDTSDHPAKEDFYFDAKNKKNLFTQMMDAARRFVQRLSKEKQHEPPAQTA